MPLNAADIVLIALLACLIGWAVRHIWRNRTGCSCGAGSGCSGCSACSNSGGCPYCK